MYPEILTRKPLVEAIFEVRWALAPQADGTLRDPYYQLLVGRLYDQVRSQFPHWEPLPTAEFPEHMFPHMIQHRFRVTEGGWPLIQLGPGLLTVNDTEGYEWPHFRNNCAFAVDALQRAYADAKPPLAIEQAMLRYIDADVLAAETPQDFLKKLKITTEVPGPLSEELSAKDEMIGFNLQWTFRAKKPKGIAQFRITQGKKQDQDAIIWETAILSKADDISDFLVQSADWIHDAHQMTHDWFYKLIEGELLEKYR